MNTRFLLLTAAAACALASCSQDAKTTETTTPADVNQVTAVDTLAYRTPAIDLSARVAADLDPADTALPRRLQPIYYNRGRTLQAIEARYTADSTGRYAALKAANDQASEAVKAAVAETQYKTYSSNAGRYYAGPYSSAILAAAKATETKASLNSRVSQGTAITKLENSKDEGKVKYENGAKIKRSDDGSLKIKRADGTKVKIDENGKRTVKKGLF